MTGFKNILVVSAVVMAAKCLAFNPAFAEGQQSLAAALNVYVFPSKGQASSQQAKDESACYDWAVQASGVDPFELAKKEQAQESPPAEPNSSRRGAGARGALRGAAGGALVGEIVDDDASKGAAIGATVGAIGARRNARKAEKAEQASAEQAAEKTAAASEQQMGNFKKGFAACLEGKDYTVKY